MPERTERLKEKRSELEKLRALSFNVFKSLTEVLQKLDEWQQHYRVPGVKKETLTRKHVTESSTTQAAPKKCAFVSSQT